MLLTLCNLAISFPNLKSVRELILKRGQAKIGKRRVPLTDNAFIEEHMGECVIEPEHQQSGAPPPASWAFSFHAGYGVQSDKWYIQNNVT